MEAHDVIAIKTTRAVTDDNHYTEEFLYLYNVYCPINRVKAFWECYQAFC